MLKRLVCFKNNKAIFSYVQMYILSWNEGLIHEQW